MDETSQPRTATHDAQGREDLMGAGTGEPRGIRNRTLTLVEFLEARLAEDEAVARAATPGPWDISGQGEMVVGPNGHGGVADTWDDRSVSSDAVHIARHDPARVLREVEAKRRIVAYLVEFMEGDYAPWNEDTLRMMASVYVDHPDYREEWS